MKVLIRKDYSGVCLWAAEHIAGRIRKFGPQKEKPFVLGLPTGSSPLGVYRELVRRHREENLSFANVATFNMDEYAGLASDHPQSYARFMKDNFFSLVDIANENTHIPDGMASDPEAECLAYEGKILSAGGIELFLGGMGSNGHLAFNEPGSSLCSRTRLKKLNRDTRIANARFFGGDMEKVPATALTIGIGTVMDSREVVIIVSGAQKSRALAAAVEGPVSQWCPISALQMHPRAVIVCDEDAAGELKFSTVKYFRDIEDENSHE